MSKYANRLIDHINQHPEFIQPVSRKNEMMNNFLLPGLQDLCVSRTSFKWGIPVDFDERHVVYVWLDALTNYITGIGYDADGNSTEQYQKLWPADLHLIGKDIIRFHTIYTIIFKWHLMQHKIPNCIHTKQLHKVVRVHNITFGLTHLVIVLQKPWMSKHLTRQFLSKCHQKNRPVNGMETNNILSY